MAAEEEVSFVATEEEAWEMTENREAEKEESAGMLDLNTSVTVCKFFLEGRCRFGESCLNKHQGSPQVKAIETRKQSKGEGRRRKKEK